jgi:hypothetical protein
VLEEYFFGFDRDKQHDSRSAGKTFASVMLGAAMREKTPIGPGVEDLRSGFRDGTVRKSRPEEIANNSSPSDDAHQRPCMQRQ